MQHYFAIDGNYGDATDLIVIHTDNLTDNDWKIIQESSDSDRQQVVVDLIYNKKEGSQTRLLGL